MVEGHIPFPLGARVYGPSIVFRAAEPADAEFILSLRLDEKKGRYLSATASDVERQRDWIKSRAGDTSEVYFIIEDRSGRAVGTVRLYDIKGSSFSWGSWILSDDKPKSSAVESTLMVYTFGLSLGFDRSHFEVMRDNEKVWQYHERMGASRTSEDSEKYYYEIDFDAIVGVLRKYGSRMPDGITVGLGPEESGVKYSYESFGRVGDA